MTPSVVCGVDHSSHARAVAALAAQLAERLELRLILVHAVPVAAPPVAAAWPTRAPYDPTRLRRSAHEAGHRLLADVIEDIGVSGATARVEDGQAPGCLVGIARGEDAEFIVVGTHGEGAAHVAVMGSVSLAVARLAPCPVVVLPPSVRHAPLTAPDAETVVCGISEPEDLQPVGVAIRLALALELSLLPVHVVPSEDEETSARTVAGIRTLLTGRVHEARTAAATPTALKATIDAAGSSRAALEGPDILVGDPATELARLAADARAAMLVVGSRGRGSIRSSLLGSVSRSLACNSTVPVVVCPDRRASA
jgi:nucleotide-binding universal stress UspA family protein